MTNLYITARARRTREDSKGRPVYQYAVQESNFPDKPFEEPYRSLRSFMLWAAEELTRRKTSPKKPKDITLKLEIR